ncbi:MAG: hypothetical protein ACYCWE_10545 [Eubacteriales bacterium]
MDMNAENEILTSVQHVYKLGGESYKIDIALLNSGSAAEVINEALDRFKYVEIPYLPGALYLSKPIVMRSGTRMTVHKDTVIRMESGCGGCMLRNENIMNGMEGNYSTEADSDILVEGGIWDGAVRSLSPYDANQAFRTFRDKDIILGVIFFSNAENFILRNMTISDGDQYAVLLASCNRFIVEDLFFDRYKKDGVHINGPSSYGLVRRLRGTTGDDFVALNAWDWCTSAVSFGSIHDMVVRDINCVHDEIRLLPGRKTYADGSKNECEIFDCSFKQMTGIYNVKMYQQPNCHNNDLGMSDRSEIAGVLRNIVFSGFELNRIETVGVGEVHIHAMFEICADCDNITIENIAVAETEEDYVNRGMHLIDVGPKSSTWTRGNSDPKTWSELFDPDLICSVKNIYFGDIRFAGRECHHIGTLAHAHRLFPNPDYPSTLPKGGTGYGIIENAILNQQ